MAEKRHHPVRNTAAGVGVVAVLAWLLGGRFGLGRGGEGLLPGEGNAPAAPAATAAPAADPRDDGVLSITVREDGLLYEGRSLSLSELEAVLLSDYREGLGVELSDDHALKGSYDEVCALLERLGLPYTERN